MFAQNALAQLLHFLILVVPEHPEVPVHALDWPREVEVESKSGNYVYL